MEREGVEWDEQRRAAASEMEEEEVTDGNVLLGFSNFFCFPFLLVWARS